ncbi:transcription termination/antitermination protein NusG [Aeoliella mucimassa]|uniref:Transcription termination/antitermination protein NusG n=1 Tax=Aeoliella mucimassa TaxID=2527972 RepID=A0A518ATY7_9BACT|nr:transcription termination/antitermination protein NusG [Aeoliella mucimassa]QDU58166.1 hypothetical protein Pan181_43980 [Aeoliella mucimassa]
MNDDVEKQEELTSGDSAAEPVAGDPAEDATPLASGDAEALEANVSGQMKEVADTSADEGAATEALEEAAEELATETGNQPADGEPTLEELEALVDDSEPEVTPSGPIEIDVPEEEDIDLKWYILKVQSNRERSIADALRRKIAIEGLNRYFGEVKVPTENVTEFKGGKKKIVERKLWPGYIAVEMHVNDDTWFAIRETSGIGDFTGAGGKPAPMDPHEVAKFQQTEVEEAEEAPKLDIKFSPGDKVKVMEGNFENFEGEVSSIDETHGRVTVMLSIFGRPTPVELEYWQVEGL